MLVGVSLLILGACDTGTDADSSNTDTPSSQCVIETNRFSDGGVARDAIPALTDPLLVAPDDVSYLSDTSRVIGLVVEGQAIAIPHNILWAHEVANFNFPSSKLAVTYCLLTGSSLTFDRAAIGGAEFGVSGLLFDNNLTLFDRTSLESLWPQMHRRAGCGPRVGAQLSMVPSLDITWAGWRALHPDTRVIAEETGFDRDYRHHPFGNYERPDDGFLLVPMEVDPRRAPKERLLGIPNGRQGGMAFPFFELDQGNPVTVVHEKIDVTSVVVFWNTAYQSAMAYRPIVDGAPLMFEVQEGRIMDLETGSTWQVDGKAVAGPLAGTQLTPIAEAYVAFWFAWAAFQPETRIWLAN